MSYLIAYPEDRFSHDVAHISKQLAWGMLLIQNFQVSLKLFLFKINL